MAETILGQGTFITDLMNMRGGLDIPQLTDKVHPGLLTCIIFACGEKVLKEMDQPYWSEEIEELARREGVSTREYEAAYLVCTGQLLYVIGCCLPHLQEGSIGLILEESRWIDARDIADVLYSEFHISVK